MSQVPRGGNSVNTVTAYLLQQIQLLATVGRPIRSLSRSLSALCFFGVAFAGDLVP
jgi:hypothetical protein